MTKGGRIMTNVKKNKAIIKRRQNMEKLPLVFLLLPFLALFTAFTVLPIVSSVVLSFFDYDMLHQLRFSGLSNYITMFLEDDVFWTCVKNTVMFAVITGPIGFLLSFILSWMVNELNRTMRTLLGYCSEAGEFDLMVGYADHFADVKRFELTD